MGSLVPLIAVVVVWGSGYLTIGAALSEGFGPLWLGGTRLLAAGGLLLLWEGRLPRATAMPSLVVAGLLAWGLGSGLQVFAQQSVSPSLAAVVMGACPVLALVLDALVGWRLPGRPQLLAVGLGFAGLVLLVGAAPTGAGSGAILLLLAALGWSCSAVWEARRPADAPPLLAAGMQMATGGVALTALAWATGEPPPAPSATGCAAWLWLTAACGALGFPLWLCALRSLPVHVTMTQPTLSPIVAAGMGWAFLGDMPTLAMLGGMGLALLGAGAAVHAERRAGPGSSV